MKNYQIYKSFPTPVFHYNLENYEEFNNSLENYILNIKNQNKDGIIKSNQGGWHSPNFDLKNDKSAKKFVSVFDKYVEKTIKEIGWNYDSKRAIIELSLIHI